MISNLCRISHAIQLVLLTRYIITIKKSKRRSGVCLFFIKLAVGNIIINGISLRQFNVDLGEQQIMMVVCWVVGGDRTMSKWCANTFII